MSSAYSISSNFNWEVPFGQCPVKVVLLAPTRKSSKNCCSHVLTVQLSTHFTQHDRWASFSWYLWLPAVQGGHRSYSTILYDDTTNRWINSPVFYVNVQIVQSISNRACTSSSLSRCRHQTCTYGKIMPYSFSNLNANSIYTLGYVVLYVDRPLIFFWI